MRSSRDVMTTPSEATGLSRPTDVITSSMNLAAALLQTTPLALGYYGAKRTPSLSACCISCSASGERNNRCETRLDVALLIAAAYASLVG